VGTIECLLDDLAGQSVRHELLAVDSGSTDGTLELVDRACDRVLRLPPGTYRPGRALNAGVEAARGEVIFAVSSHCRLPRRDWMEQALALYADERVVATNGAERDPLGRPLTGTHHQTAAEARANPYWGFSNHASSWRKAAWRDHRFSETLPTAEDKEWALRVLDAGWTIAYRPELVVDMSHRWRQGTLRFLRRERLEAYVLGSYLPLPDYGLLDLAHEWWSPAFPRHPLARERVNPRRLAGLVGKYLGHRDHRRAVRLS
jgi:glycosyltransferase involved in cell wall biosynthesis